MLGVFCSQPRKDPVRGVSLFPRRIPVLFGETSVPDKGIRAVLETVRKEYKFEARMAEARLYSDALGEAGSGAETYIGMVRHNIDSIVKALAQ